MRPNPDDDRMMSMIHDTTTVHYCLSKRTPSLSHSFEPGLQGGPADPAGARGDGQRLWGGVIRDAWLIKRFIKTVSLRLTTVLTLSFSCIEGCVVERGLGYATEGRVTRWKLEPAQAGCASSTYGRIVAPRCSPELISTLIP